MKCTCQDESDEAKEEVADKCDDARQDDLPKKRLDLLPHDDRHFLKSFNDRRLANFERFTWHDRPFVASSTNKSRTKYAVMPEFANLLANPFLLLIT